MTYFEVRKLEILGKLRKPRRDSESLIESYTIAMTRRELDTAARRAAKRLERVWR